MINLKIRGKEYQVSIADTEESREKGLQGVKSLADNEGMLFVFDEADTVSFWMKDTPLNLDIVFINESDEVIKVSTGYADTENPHTADDCMYVLEVAQGSGIKVGDEVEVEKEDDIEDEDEINEDEVDDIDEDEKVLMILNAKGGSQMDLAGGERIFSRKNTLSLLKFAKRAYTTKSTASYKTLGKKVFDFMDIQDSRENDYVELPK